VYGTHGVRLVERGWPAAIPLVPCEKRPAIKGWETYNTAVVSVEQAERWSHQYPNHGIGHAAGHGLVGIDLDTDEKKQATKAKQIADACLGSTPMIRIGRPPRVMRYYRLFDFHLDRVATRSFHLFALYATTGQTAWYGIHPSTRKPYEWSEASPLDIGPDDLPAVTAADLEAFVEEMTKAFPQCPGSDPKTDKQLGQLSKTAGGITASIMSEMALSPRTSPIEIALRWIASAPVGTRHHTMIGAVVALVHAGLCDQEIYDAVFETHLESVGGDRPTARLKRVVQSAVEWARSRVGADLASLDKGLHVSDWTIWS
jgi:hypothetical protein